MQRPAGLDFIENGERAVPLDPDDLVVVRVAQIFEEISDEDLAQGLAEEAKVLIRLNGHKISEQRITQALYDLLGKIEGTVFLPAARKRSLHDLAMKFLREPAAPVEASVHVGQVVIRISA